MELDEFLEMLAKARYLEEVEARIVAMGIVEAFGEE